MTVREMDAWLKEAKCSILADALAAQVARSSAARSKMEKWITSTDETVGRAGWTLLAHLATNDNELPDSCFEDYLATIERDIHTAKNRVREAMNNALIAIGMRNDALEERALGVAKAIGKVIIDHGQTSCKTPDASAYIRKGRERQRTRAAQALPA
jgi:3-methyladenine DNA glycosylase AlkD